MRVKKVLHVFFCAALTIILVSSPLSVNAAKYPGMGPAAKAIVEAIKTDDVEAVAAMFSAYVQNKMPYLNERIEALFQSVDGDLNAYEVYGSGGTDEVNYGYYYSRVGFDIVIPAGDYIFVINASWIKACSDRPDQVGLSLLSVNMIVFDGPHYDIEYLYEIGLPAEKTLHYREQYQNYAARSDKREQMEYMGYELIRLESTDESVATIDENGVVTATGRGTAIITVTYQKTTTGSTFTSQDEVTVTFTIWQKIIWYLFFGFLWY